MLDKEKQALEQIIEETPDKKHLRLKIHQYLDMMIKQILTKEVKENVSKT